MDAEHQLLWEKIDSFELDDLDSSLAFSDRLSRENGWQYEFSVRAVREYKKFIFLVSISGQPLTPSDEVDQVWHLHLLYTYSYWKELCGKILNKEIHHGPTKGGRNEQLKFTNWYLETLRLYKFHFRHDPPGDLWPEPEKRFKRINFQRVNVDSNWIVKKPFQ